MITEMKPLENNPPPSNVNSASGVTSSQTQISNPAPSTDEQQITNIPLSAVGGARRGGEIFHPPPGMKLMPLEKR